MRNMIRHLVSMPGLCTRVSPTELDPDARHDAGEHRPAAEWCTQMHDWEPCSCGYRPPHTHPVGTWHYPHECS